MQNYQKNDWYFICHQYDTLKNNIKDADTDTDNVSIINVLLQFQYINRSLPHMSS